MITRIATVTVLVRDQDIARSFYVDKLGFEVRDDAGADDYRWLVVAPRGSKGQVYLAKGGPGSLHEGERIGGQTGIMFECADVRATYAQLVARGVNFPQPPTNLPYGMQAQFEDPDGNVSFSSKLMAAVRAAFDSCVEALASHLRRAGLPPARSRALATAALAAMEGALILCRAEGTVEPFDTVAGQVKWLARPSRSGGGLRT